MNNEYNSSRRRFIKQLSLTSLALVPGNVILANLLDEETNPALAATSDKLINAAFRLRHYQNMLDLEFYFINVKQEGKYIKPLLDEPSRYSSYMIVRLPQQHIAEEYVSATTLRKETDKDCNVSYPLRCRISGYSYLCFGIEFFHEEPGDPGSKPFCLEVSPKSLMDWNAPHFHLISKPDNNTRPFRIDEKTRDVYPLGYKDGKFNKDAYPNQRENDAVISTIRDAAPFTALEIPYGLIISPRLPSWEYTYTWIFTSYIGNRENIEGGYETELWMATLKLVKKQSFAENLLLSERKEQHKTVYKRTGDAPSDSEEIVNRGDNQMHLLILGPYQKQDSGSAKIKTLSDRLGRRAPKKTGYAKQEDEKKASLALLPNEQDKNDLSTLFNDFELYATTPSLTFTPLGVCTHISFKNKLYENNKISLYEWRQSISFGRDQEVEVSNIVTESTFGLKMLHVRTTRRETHKGRAILVARDFLMPLDGEKDFSTFGTAQSSKEYNNENYKYNTPFCKVAFADTNPKQILPPHELKGDAAIVSEEIDRESKAIQDRQEKKCVQEDVHKSVLAFWATTPDNRYLEWPITFTDWSGNEKTLKIKLFILTANLRLQKEFHPPAPSGNGTNNTPDPSIAELIKVNTIATPNIWDKVMQLSEEFKLTKIDTLKSRLANELKTLEDTLLAVARTPGWDIEDTVMEEWALFKRNALGVDKSIEGIYNNLIQKLEDLAKQYKLEMPTGVENLKSLNEKIKAIKESYEAYLVSVSNRKPYDELCRDAIKQIKALIGDKAIESVLVKIENGLSYYPEYVNYFNHKITELSDIETKIKDTVETKYAGYRYELEQFWSKLPADYTRVIKGTVKKELVLLSDVVNYLQHAESDLKSKIDGAKAQICYAVHSAEDELSGLKDKVLEKYEKVAAAVNQKIEDYKDEIAEEYARYSKAYNDAVNGRVATMKTDYLVFRKNLRMTAEKKAFDIFHEYCCYPQLHTAQVYMDHLSDMVQKQLPIKINYATDYLQNQVDNFSLEVKNNASRVFAEIQSDAQERVKGALREAAKELGGIINPEIAAHYITLLKDNSKKAVDEIKDIPKDIMGSIWEEFKTVDAQFNAFIKEYDVKFQGARNQLLTLTKDAKDTLKAAQHDAQLQAQAFFKDLEAKILGSIRIKDLLGDDFNLPKLDRKNNKVTYQFITSKFKRLDLSMFSFQPESTTSLQVYMEKPFSDPRAYRSWTRLQDFTIGIFAERLKIKFKYIQISSTQNEKKKVSLGLGDIIFGKELAFLAKLQSGFQLPGTGLTIKLSNLKIELSYALAIPGISGGAFTFDNLRFVIGTTIPLPGISQTNEPMGIILGINSPTDQFAVGVLIFGGKGFFTIETTPKYLRKVDSGMTFGGLFRINLVIASGEAYLQAGVRYVYNRSSVGETSIELYALVTCGANVTVFGFISVSVVFTMYMKYKQEATGSSLYGVASVSYSVRIGFFTKSFTLTFSHRIAGSDNKRTASLNRKRNEKGNAPDWRKTKLLIPSGNMYQDADGTWLAEEEFAPNHETIDARAHREKEELVLATEVLVKLFKTYKRQNTQQQPLAMV